MVRKQNMHRSKCCLAITPHYKLDIRNAEPFRDLNFEPHSRRSDNTPTTDLLIDWRERWSSSLPKHHRIRISSMAREEVAGPEGGPEPPFPIRLSGKIIKGFGRGSKEVCNP